MSKEFLKHTKDKAVIGIGTGTTVESYIEMLSPDAIYVSSSIRTALVLSEKGFVVSSPLGHDSLDLYIDGADYFDRSGNLIKGGGGALTMEKLLYSMAKEALIMVQAHKYRETFDECLVPIEIIPASLSRFISILRENRLEYCLRETPGKIGPLITDLGNCIVDVEYDIDFISSCRGICGVVEHGLFVSDGSVVVVEDRGDNDEGVESKS